MGGTSSKHGSSQQAVAAANHTPLPVDSSPYPGPMRQYLFLNVNVEMKAHVGFNFSPGTSLMSSDVDKYYSIIAQQYKDGFKIVQFLKIPGSQQTTGFFSPSVLTPYQAVYCRKVEPGEQVTTWQLKIEKSMVFMSQMRPGILFSLHQQPATSDLSHIYQIVCQNADLGGRFVCMELTGQASSQGMGAAMAGVSPGMGIDLFFNMPLHPNPKMYSYMAVSVPIQMSYRFGFKGSIDLVCDWLGILGQHLNQGWRLADIFLVNTMNMYQNDHHHHQMPAPVMNSVWFFEKERDKINDMTPLYEGTFVECHVKIKPGFGAITSDFNITQICQEMGNRGWKLTCFIETPKVISTGFASVKMAVMLFFERRIVGPPAVPYGTAGSIPVDSNSAPPPQYNVPYQDAK